jgi:hypothetical protein
MAKDCGSDISPVSYQTPPERWGLKYEAMTFAFLEGLILPIHYTTSRKYKASLCISLCISIH